MKKILLIVFVLTSVVIAAQTSHIYAAKGFAVKGYDVVAYFENRATKGDSEKYLYQYEGVNFVFSSEKNLAAFKNDPIKYVPQYGGHCSYAMATSGRKVSPNPDVFEIREGKLYLFHRAKGLEKWLEGDTEKLRKQADKNWEKIVGG